MTSLGAVQRRIVWTLTKCGASSTKALIDYVYPEPPDLGPYQTPSLKGTIHQALRSLRRRGWVEVYRGRPYTYGLTGEGLSVALRLYGFPGVTE